MFFSPFFSGPSVSYMAYQSYQPAYGYGFNGFNHSAGFGGYGRSSSYEPWDPSRLTVCGFGSDTGSGARPDRDADRYDLKGLILDQAREQAELSNRQLDQWVTKLEALLGSRTTDVVVDLQPRVRFVEGPDMFRSKPDCGRCAPTTTTTTTPPPPPPVVDNSTELPSVGTGGVTSPIATGLTRQVDWTYSPV